MTDDQLPDDLQRLERLLVRRPQDEPPTELCRRTSARVRAELRRQETEHHWWRVADVWAALRRAAGDYQQPIPLLRRILTVKNLTISAGVLSAAAAVVLIVTLTPASVTLADVAKRVQEARTLCYTQVYTYSSDPGAPRRTKEYCRDDGKGRIEFDDGTIAIADGEDHAILLDPRKKQATRNLTFGFMYFTDRDGGASYLVRQIAAKVDKPTKELGDRDIRGRRVKGFVCQDDGEIWTIWVDKKNAAPVLVDISYPKNGDSMAFRRQISDIEINPVLDDSMFSLEIPSGYTLRRPTKPEDTVDLRIITKKDANGKEQREYQYYGRSKSSDSPKK